MNNIIYKIYIKKFSNLHSFPKLNLNQIKKKQAEINSFEKKKSKKEKNWKNFYYFLGVLFPSVYIYFVLKASGLFKQLKIDQKIKENKILKDQKYNLNSELLDKKIKQFEEDWDINYKENLKDHRNKFGNKELNEVNEDLNVDNFDPMVEPGLNYIKLDLNENKNKNNSNNSNDPKLLSDSIMFFEEVKQQKN